jgi:hypothetical protein
MTVLAIGLHARGLEGGERVIGGSGSIRTAFAPKAARAYIRALVPSEGGRRR